MTVASPVCQKRIFCGHISLTPIILHGTIEARAFMASLTAPGFANEDPLSHYRKGAVGGWRKYFTPTVIGWYKEEAGEQLIKEGYELNYEWQGLE